MFKVSCFYQKMHNCFARVLLGFAMPPHYLAISDLPYLLLHADCNVSVFRPLGDGASRNLSG